MFSIIEKAKYAVDMEKINTLSHKSNKYGTNYETSYWSVL